MNYRTVINILQYLLDNKAASLLARDTQDRITVTTTMSRLSHCISTLIHPLQLLILATMRGVQLLHGFIHDKTSSVGTASSS